MNYSFNTNASEEEISIHNKMTHVIEADRYRFLDHFRIAKASTAKKLDFLMPTTNGTQSIA